MGLFYPFIDDVEVKLVGVEAAGEGIESGRHSASLGEGRIGVLHGSKSLLLQDDHGQITEARQQLMEAEGRLPDYAVACVGGGSNSIGLFYPFISDASVKLVGVEAGGEGVESGRHAATLVAGRPGVLHGTMSYLLQDEHGQVKETHSISAGLDYPGVGPEHSHLKDTGRAQYVAVTDAQALEGFHLLSRTEGIIPALEPAHAIYHVSQLAPTLSKDDIILLGLSGRGDKDIFTVADAIGVKL